MKISLKPVVLRSIMTAGDQAQSVLIELIIGNDAWKYDSDFFYKDSTISTPFLYKKAKGGVPHLSTVFL